MKSPLFRLGFGLLALLALFVWYRFRQPRFEAGENAPDFSVALADGTTIDRNAMRGRYVLLQFWGSWCGPCRLENRELVPLYAKFHPVGFEILSIGMENNPLQWQQAIEQDNLIWKWHAMESADLEGPLTKLFNVHTIPATFLINPDGKIMGVNRSPDEIEKLLETHLSRR